ncbi:MAG: nucleotidyltransferase family protein [Candidatus Methanoperedens sp.]|nr:nucleotidyltransferase family protein [Candidatus Methanoperedens sp.]MCZ7371123.1 nucleotidyltransferase family protein [Candidatus Methanoperedens sp.]
MKTLEEIKKILKTHKGKLKERFGVNEIGIFGSIVRGEQKEISDVDILVEFEKPIGWDVVDLAEYLEAILGIKVDLVLKGGVIRKTALWNYIKKELVHV